jgi:hypothetical protein
VCWRRHGASSSRFGERSTPMPPTPTPPRKGEGMRALSAAHCPTRRGGGRLSRTGKSRHGLQPSG